MEIDHPILLLLIVPAAFFLWFAARKNYAHLGPRQRALSIAIRLAVVLFLLASLSDVSLLLAHRDESILLLLDVSDSMPPEAVGESWKTIRQLPPGPKMGLILFAGEARLAIPLQEKE
ncbi:MAG: hypothetical protein O6952_00555, partial [Planctomycetota bacterium]|nr:hypothetical protein [Planctomycetota bacterium]